MSIRHRFVACGLAAVMGIGIVAVPTTARASEEGHKNTAMALGAAAAALLLTQKNKTAGIIAGAGAIIAAKNREDAIAARHRRERDYWNYRDDRDFNRRDRFDNRREYDSRWSNSSNRDWNNRYDRNRRDDDDCEEDDRGNRPRYRRDDYRYNDWRDNGRGAAARLNRDRRGR
jgi:hypothetical protein